MKYIVSINENLLLNSGIDTWIPEPYELLEDIIKAEKEKGMQYHQNQYPLQSMCINDKFTFGKYAGMTPRELLHNKKGLYLMWCLHNIKGFHIEPVSLEQGIRLKYRKQYLRVYKKNRYNNNV